MDERTQLREIRRALLNGETFTPMDALRRFGCFGLSGRILDLRAEGLNIETWMEKSTSGRGKHARYKLIPKGQLFNLPEPVRTDLVQRFPTKDDAGL
jgi:Helix-turn-helix domain